ncbi:GntR family transcriptional regulator [Staphylococcus kloosii]|jgi:GntR family transcriptional regulator|uniref:GntR family transcriptional regulator n=1 Tax=Staphylococcus kloosii TaxID=29384 RepID=A0A921H041_9STAP|nr:GntR family transcriptional regulator [Staphylococcus kloosii]AVQ36346.1 GntR family transcriptional regulator [Staphylococcus kloosii]MBF7022246.1 GntR family transcriptional regulator [Staphylococcus kloosii]MBF7024082.1 GntR family transcriptional regulator [Staphylococcus kloosii]MBF7029167.1 GntR family transcriptional regulator [Staphylococcus kloosii]MCD8878478.1 GntR family transcriptional regulator [Staphylococcus kloosii]
MELTSVYKVKEWILNQIKAGKLNNGDKLPSYLSIARDLKVKTDDVYDGVDELITEQILTNNLEEGVSVKPLHPFLYPLGELVSISKMIEEQGYNAGTEFISLDEKPATSLDAYTLEIEDKTLVTIIERIRTADQFPVVYCLDKIPNDDLTCFQYQENRQSILNAIEQNSNKEICYAETEIEAISYEPHISDLLNASPHEGLMLLKLVHYDQNDKPVFYSFNYFKSSLVKFKTVRNRV